MPDAAEDFRMLYQLHAPAVRRFVLFLGADAASADDVVAETFARAWTSAGPLREATVKAYLFTIARNLHRRATKRARQHDVLPADLPDEGISAQRAAEDRSDLQAVLNAMRLLSEEDRTALLLRATERMSYRDIARTLGLSVATAKVRVHRARLKLMRVLANGDPALQLPRSRRNPPCPQK
jgi:RNA polymerase sigma-70 factor (ECF subfamily)